MAASMERVICEDGVKVSDDQPDTSVVNAEIIPGKDPNNEINADNYLINCLNPSSDQLALIKEGVTAPNLSPGCWGVRHSFALMSFLGFVNVYAMRVNLNIAIVDMVSGSGYDRNNSNVGHQCPFYNDSKTNSSSRGEFDWNSEDQGQIISSFFYGYIVTQIPAGILSEKYGGKWFFGIGTFTTSFLSLLTPLAAKAGKDVLIFVRILGGLGEGVTFPSMNAMMAQWIPRMERSKLSAFIWTGSQFGTILALPLSGILAEQLGWEAVFYVFGAAGCVWCIFWILLVFNSPETHPRITTNEKLYIQANTLLKASNSVESHPPSPPLFRMMTSPAFLVLILAHCGQSWGFYTLLNEIPTYLQFIQHFMLQNDSLMSALPYVFMFIMSPLFGTMADWLIRTHRLSVRNTRKVMQIIGQCIPAIALIGMSYVGCNKTMSIVWICIAVGFNGASYSGFNVNHVELSPNYAGTMMGITNMFANIMGIITPQLTGIITLGNPTFQAWRKVFLTSSGVYLGCTFFFVLFGKSDVQPWNTYWETENQA